MSSQDDKNRCDFCGREFNREELLRPSKTTEPYPIVIETANLEEYPSGKVNLCRLCAWNASVICERCHKTILSEEQHWFLKRFYCNACIVIVHKEDAEREAAEQEIIEAAKYKKWTEKCEKDWEERTGKKLPRASNGVRKLLEERNDDEEH